MKTYIISIFVLSIFVLILHSISDRFQAMKPYLVFITGLVSALIVFSPILTVMKSLADTFELTVPSVPDDTDESNESLLLQKAEKTLARKIQASIPNYLSEKIISIKTVVTYDKSQAVFYLSQIIVAVDEEEMGNLITDYLQNEYSCEIVIILRGDSG